MKEVAINSQYEPYMVFLVRWKIRRDFFVMFFPTKTWKMFLLLSHSDLLRSTNFWNSTSLGKRFLLINCKKFCAHLNSHLLYQLTKPEQILLVINHCQNKIKQYQILKVFYLLLNNVSIHYLDGLGLCILLFFYGFSWLEKTSKRTVMYTRSEICNLSIWCWSCLWIQYVLSWWYLQSSDLP